MKILVCISKAPDTTAKISFKNNDSEFNEDGVQFIINPYDEWYALVRGLELKEANGGSVTVLNVGTAENDPIIRKSLAIGADDAVRIDAAAEDALTVAKEIASYAKEQHYDLVLTGKETINYNGSQVAGMLSELLSMPFVSLASKLDIENGKAIVERDIQGGTEVIESDLPLIISAAKGMAEARIPNMRGIMAARTKPLQVVPAQHQDLKTGIKWYQLPSEKAECRYIDAENPGELIELLHNEAKVI